MWDNEKITALLKKHEDKKYKEFHGGLTFTAYERIGVRVPVLRALAKEIIRSGEWEGFLSVRPILFYEQAMLCGIISASVKEAYEDKIKRLKEFSGMIDDWAVCDVTCSGLKCKDDRLFGDACAFAASSDMWLARMGLVIILGNFADRKHLCGIRDAINSVRAKGYYIDMAVGWLICTVESHDRGAGIELMLTTNVSQTVRKIAAGKMRDSYRVSDESKKKAKEIANG